MQRNRTCGPRSGKPDFGLFAQIQAGHNSDTVRLFIHRGGKFIRSLRISPSQTPIKWSARASICQLWTYLAGSMMFHARRMKTAKSSSHSWASIWRRRDSASERSKLKASDTTGYCSVLCRGVATVETGPIAALFAGIPTYAAFTAISALSCAAMMCCSKAWANDRQFCA